MAVALPLKIAPSSVAVAILTALADPNGGVSPVISNLLIVPHCGIDDT